MKDLTHGRPTDLVVRARKKDERHKDLTAWPESASDEAWYNKPVVQLAFAMVTGASTYDMHVGLALIPALMVAYVWLNHGNVDERMLISPEPSTVFSSRKQPTGWLASLRRQLDDQSGERQPESASASR